MRLEDSLRGGRKLIGFTVAGDPDFETSYNIACDIIDSGADVLELGLPFSDPVADGPTIQKAGQRALKAGMNTDLFFELAQRLYVKYDAPLVCLTYYNIVLQYGLGRFAKACRQSGVRGLVVPDLPLEEAGPLRRELRLRDVDFIFLVAQTTTDERLRRILAQASGFVYVVAQLGTTGARDALSPKLKGLIARVRKRTKVPVAVGFGISGPQHVKAVLDMGADAAIVGSAIVGLVPERGKVKEYVQGLKRAALLTQTSR